MAAPSDWLGVVLGGGGAAFLAAVYQGVKMWRDGSSVREQRAIAGLERWRQDADKRAERESMRADYFQQVAGVYQTYVGTLSFELSSHGHPVPPMPPLPPRPTEPPHESPAPA